MTHFSPNGDRRPTAAGAALHTYGRKPHRPEVARDLLTDLGLDSLMGVEIETMLESAIGVALPPTSLMRARTIGQIANDLAREQIAAPVFICIGKACSDATIAGREVSLRRVEGLQAC